MAIPEDKQIVGSDRRRRIIFEDRHPIMNTLRNQTADTFRRIRDR